MGSPRGVGRSRLPRGVIDLRSDTWIAPEAVVLDTSAVVDFLRRRSVHMSSGANFSERAVRKEHCSSSIAWSRPSYTTRSSTSPYKNGGVEEPRTARSDTTEESASRRYPKAPCKSSQIHSNTDSLKQAPIGSSRPCLTRTRSLYCKGSAASPLLHQPSPAISSPFAASSPSRAHTARGPAFHT
jgi:hypothetical protein